MRARQNCHGQQCPFYPGSKHSATECDQLKKRGFTPKAEKGKPKDKADDDQDNQDGGGKDFRPVANVVNLIFGGVATSTSKRKDKLTLREIMAAKPATPRYLDWSEYLIQFTIEDQWTRFSNANRYPLVLNPTIAGVQLTEVLIDDGAGLNIIFYGLHRPPHSDRCPLLRTTGYYPGRRLCPSGR